MLCSKGKLLRPMCRQVYSIISRPLSFRQIISRPESSLFALPRSSCQAPLNTWIFHQRRSLSHRLTTLVISPQGKPKFEINEVDPPKKEKWLTKKMLKLQRKKEKQKRKAANKRDTRRLGVKGQKKRQRFVDAEERIKYKLENARRKEALLIERLKRYEVAKAEGPVVEPHLLTGEERFYMKKMAQKGSNYVPVGRRGIFGGVILNMHMHWKKHETVKVFCKPCKPGHVQEYADEIARLSGGVPIQIIGDDTIIFYRGKNYVQPKVMSPVDTLSKKRALEKSKYEQSLESVRRFIAIAEKELELYYRHIALYGDPSDRDPKQILDSPRTKSGPPKVVGITEKSASIRDNYNVTLRLEHNYKENIIDEAFVLSSTLSTKTSTIAHWVAFICLQCRAKYTSLAATIGVIIWISAHICHKRSKNHKFNSSRSPRGVAKPQLGQRGLLLGSLNPLFSSRSLSISLFRREFSWRS